ncbi:MarR family transcriptional regulator [Leptospira kobayashii]|uniref:MarR family transcriptional regulator n=1 Tax=Leptospira kobayashii TaxID=1917830 RepID=A0ABN6K8W1_9LEPT|nr:MarR family transcriptional regulator [Leptospira kobayashii]BDA77357.1 MarR family transcriptional regulator [Leptospira kobayashii]
MKKTQTKEVSDLKKHIGFWMRIVSNNVSHSFAKKLETQGFTVAEWVVLREMHECKNTIVPSYIADLTGLTRGAISKLVDRLLEKGFVTRKESSNDRRYQEIELTKEAKHLLPKLASIADENDEQFFSVLSLSERKTLTELLRKTAEFNQLTKLPIE